MKEGSNNVKDIAKEIIKIQGYQNKNIDEAKIVIGEGLDVVGIETQDGRYITLPKKIVLISAVS